MKPHKEPLFNLKRNPITGWPDDRIRYGSENYGNRKGHRAAMRKYRTRDIDDSRLKELSNRIRWRQARRVKGYKFSGKIPRPKEISDYIPWMLDDL